MSVLQQIKDYFEDKESVSNSFLKAVLEGSAAIKDYFTHPQEWEMYKSKGLLNGSMVDLLLSSPSEFQDEFVIDQGERPTDKLVKICYDILNDSALIYDDLTDEDIDEYCKVLGYYSDDKYDANPDKKKPVSIRVTNFRNTCEDFYRFISSVGNRKMINLEEYDNAQRLANMLRSHQFTSPFFTELEKIKGVHVKNQLSIKWEHEGVKCKGLLDKVAINLSGKDQVLSNGYLFYNEMILIMDYKTTGYPIERTDEAIERWNYDQSMSWYKFGMQQYKSIFEKKLNKTLGVAEPILLFVSSKSDYPIWRPMNHKVIMQGRDKWIEGLRKYKGYRDSGQWDIDPDILINNGKQDCVISKK